MRTFSAVWWLCCVIIPAIIGGLIGAVAGHMTFKSGRTKR